MFREQLGEMQSSSVDLATGTTSSALWHDNRISHNVTKIVFGHSLHAHIEQRTAESRHVSDHILFALDFSLSLEIQTFLIGPAELLPRSHGSQNIGSI